MRAKSRLAPGLALLLTTLVFGPSGCLVDSYCSVSADCPSGHRCDEVSGQCTARCRSNSDCVPGKICETETGECKPAFEPLAECPYPDMQLIDGEFCVDRYESSRPDATATSAGVQSGPAQNVPGVLPWEVGGDDGANAVAAAACEAAGKSLCEPTHWEKACRGSAGTTYGYGDQYEPNTCNGIDTFGWTGLHLMPTGSFEDCTNDFGVLDMNGNLWEHVAGGSGRAVRGGAFNCKDSRKLHRCDYVPGTWTPSALGFRCCYWVPEGSSPAPADTVGGDAVASDGGGCLDPDTGAPDVDTGCTLDAECEGEFAVIPACFAARCVQPGGTCALLPVADGESCDDGDPCTVGDTCAAGVCQAGGDTLPCDDDNLCTDDVCQRGTGCVSTPNTAPCDDGDACTEGDTCADGACVGGPSICGCTGDADCAQYEDGDLCNGTLFCDLGLPTPGCVVDPATVVTCPAPALACRVSACVPATGQCTERAEADGAPCDDGDLCTGGDHCQSGVCVGGDEDLCPNCPPEMVPVGDTFCMDRWEASRPDATATNFGLDERMATSRPGVLPWFSAGMTFATAREKCEAAGKRLCTRDEFMQTCRGTADTEYFYGEQYDAGICNGIDAFCRCGEGTACADVEVCPFPHCFNGAPGDAESVACGADFHYVPTGSFPDCVNEYGAFDIHGNVWELIDGGDDGNHFKGGAYNCGNSERLHACSYEATSAVSAKGFRCCLDQNAGETK